MISFRNIKNNMNNSELLDMLYILLLGPVVFIVSVLLVCFVMWEPLSYEFGRFCIIVLSLILTLGHINWRINKDTQ